MSVLECLGFKIRPMINMTALKIYCPPDRLFEQEMQDAVAYIKSLWSGEM